MGGEHGQFERKPGIRPIAPPDRPLAAEPAHAPFLEPLDPGDDPTSVATATPRRIILAIDGRNTNGAGRYKLVARTFDAMQAEVAATAAGDALYPAGRMFNPGVPLALGPVKGAATWGELLRTRALAGAQVCVSLTEFDARTPFLAKIRGDIAARDRLIAGMPAAQRRLRRRQGQVQP